MSFLERKKSQGKKKSKRGKWNQMTCPKLKKWCLIQGSRRFLLHLHFVVEEVRTFKFLCTTIFCDPKWDEYRTKKAQQQIFILGQKIQSVHPDWVLPHCSWEHPYSDNNNKNQSVHPDWVLPRCDWEHPFIPFTVWNSIVHQDKDQLERLVLCMRL